MDSDLFGMTFGTSKSWKFFFFLSFFFFKLSGVLIKKNLVLMKLYLKPLDKDEVFLSFWDDDPLRN